MSKFELHIEDDKFSTYLDGELKVQGTCPIHTEWLAQHVKYLGFGPVISDAPDFWDEQRKWEKEQIAKALSHRSTRVKPRISGGLNITLADLGLAKT